MTTDGIVGGGPPHDEGQGNVGDLGSITGYESITYLRSGGTSVLYTARRSSDDETVVLKVFDREQATAAQRQWSMAQRLDGVPDVLRVSERVVLDDGRQVVVMPYVAGGSLADHMTRFGPMSTEMVIDIGIRLATALQRAHDAGVLHRDLKPSNVLLTGDGAPMLCDFGAATDIDVGTATETMAITVLYAAPEVLEGAPADTSSDVYSLGLTLWSAAVGRAPFEGMNVVGLASLVNEICTVGPSDPATSGVPHPLASVLRRATALDPGERHSSAAELADALRETATFATADVGSSPASGANPSTGNAATSTGRRAAATAALAANGADSTSSSRGRRWVRVALTAIVAMVVALVAVMMAGRPDDSTERVRAAAGPTGSTEPTGTTLPTADPTGEPVAVAETVGGELVQITDDDGVLGPLFQIDDFTYQGQMIRECKRSERWVAFSIHADQTDRVAGIDEPWRAVAGDQAGTFMAYLPCENGGRDIRYVLRAPGRWFVVVAVFPQDQYDRMVGWMRENETSPAPDYTVDDEIRATLGDPVNYLGSAIIDRSE